MLVLAALLLQSDGIRGFVRGLLIRTRTDA
jgi:hypothetical protein